MELQLACCFHPDKRNKVIFGAIRKHLGEVLHELARQKECQIDEGHLMRDHVHMCISIPPKDSISWGKVRFRSMARHFMGRAKNFTSKSFWGSGYFFATVRLDEDMVRAYICNQGKVD
ncbi:transposase [Halomonas sp. BC04]|nr:transposase [Halomonas sp. BC04]